MLGNRLRSTFAKSPDQINPLSRRVACSAAGHDLELRCLNDGSGFMGEYLRAGACVEVTAARNRKRKLGVAARRLAPMLESAVRRLNPPSPFS
jgi:hypothetical protein